MRRNCVLPASLAAILTLGFILGCGNTNQPAPKRVPKPSPNTAQHPEVAPHGHEHAAHGAGSHGGAVADWGGGKYHVEFTVDHDQQEATVYILGDDEKTPTPVKAETLLLSISDPKFQVELAPAPLDGEEDGLCSRFVGKDEKLGVVQEFAGTISAEVDGTPYAGSFQEEPHDSHENK